MIKTGINDLELFKKFINSLSHVIDEVILELKGRDMSVTFMDPSRIMLMTATLKDILEKKVEIKLFIQVDNLKKMLKTFKHKDVVALEIEGHDLTFVFRRGKERLKYIQLGAFDNEAISLDNLNTIEYSCEFEIKKSKFDDIIKKSSSFNEMITLSFDESGIEFKTESSTGEYFRKTKKFIKMDKKGKSAYSIIFLKFVTTALFDNTLKISLKTDKPLKIECHSSIVDITMYLAPRFND